LAESQEESAQSERTPRASVQAWESLLIIILTKYNRKGCKEDNLNVRKERIVIQILEVKTQALQHLLNGVSVPIVKGSVGEEPRTYRIEANVIRVTLHNLVDEELALGARSDERHLPPDYIPKLREFIEVVSTDEGTDLRQTAVSISKELGTIPSFSIHTHGAELIQRERLTLIADTLLAVDDIPLRVFPLDEQGNQGDQGREENQRN